MKDVFNETGMAATHIANFELTWLRCKQEITEVYATAFIISLCFLAGEMASLAMR